MTDSEKQFVSRAGAKLQHALTSFDFDPSQKICADLGCSTGGFTDCLLQNGAAHVFSVDTGYGVLEWKLRNDPRTTVMERTNALHAEFPEPLDLVVIDAGWTLQKKIIPKALEYLKPEGHIITLVKPHYEAGHRSLKRTNNSRLSKKIPDEELPKILDRVLAEIAEITPPEGTQFQIIDTIASPVTGSKGGNTEFLTLIHKQPI